MDNIFSGIKTVAEVKSLWKLHMTKVHPDKHPAVEFDMWNHEAQMLNALYHDALKRLDGATSTDADTGKQYTYHYNYEREQAVVDKIEETLKASIPDSVTIWLIGSWIWVEGTTREDKETQAKLKALGYWWHSTRQMWYWREKAYHGRANANGFDALKAAYGAQRIGRPAREDSAQLSA